MGRHGDPEGDDTAVAGDRPAGAAEPLADVTDEAVPGAPRRDRVDAAGLGSFPASDPPGWWSGA